MHQDQLELLEKGINNNDVKADMGQFWKLLKKLNSTHIEIERTEKENLETDLVSLLMKLKKAKIYRTCIDYTHLHVYT